MQRHRRLRRAVSLLRLATIALALAFLASSCRLLETPTEEEITFQRLAQTSYMYDANGTLIRSFHGVENRTAISLAQVPQVVRNAVIAIEDQRFYTHHGVDVRALIRAAYSNVKAGEIVQGGSTITEQLVKKTITGDERTLDRKVREAIIAYRLEEEQSKDWILERYLNTVYFGEGAYGIEEAAETYFDRPASKLTLGQGALLAGLIRSPATYDPIANPGVAIGRRNQVLQNMLSLDMIDEATYRSAIDNPLGIRPPSTGRYPAPYFVQEVMEWLFGQPVLGPSREARVDQVFTGGLRIYTTVDLEMQEMADAAVRTILPYKKDPYAGMTVSDPRSGAIRALVGGRDFFAPRWKDPYAKVNLATFRGGTSRQAGSAFKPFTLVTALENAISPAQRYPAPPSIEIELPEDCRGPENEPVWPVQNYDGTGSGRPSVEEATISSLNVVYAQLVQDLGRGNPCDGAQLVVDVAKRMGIGSQLFAVPSATLGTNLVNTMEMARAYGTLATMGKRFDPMMVTRITDAEGNVLYQGESRGEQAVNPGVAWTAVEIMKKVVQYGTGSAADIGRPAAGKTGTSQEWRNAWFVGFIPQLVASVWVGFPQGDIDMVSPRTRLFHVTGGTWPAMIWHEFMAKATATMPVQEFATPDIDFVFVTVDTNTGCLATDATPRRYRQNLRFVEGLEPSERCEEEIGDLPVPSVVGLSKADAVATIQDYGFRAVVETRAAADVEPGTVLSQSPAGGEQAPLASTVTITVAGEDPAEAKVNVPNVVGLLRSGAIATLQAAGFKVNVVDQWRCRPPSSCGAEPIRVWDQEPNAGAQLQPGSTVTIWANEGG